MQGRGEGRGREGGTSKLRLGAEDRGLLRAGSCGPGAWSSTEGLGMRGKGANYVGMGRECCGERNGRVKGTGQFDCWRQERQIDAREVGW